MSTPHSTVFSHHLGKKERCGPKPSGELSGVSRQALKVCLQWTGCLRERYLSHTRLISARLRFKYGLSAASKGSQALHEKSSARDTPDTWTTRRNTAGTSFGAAASAYSPRIQCQEIRSLNCSICWKFTRGHRSNFK